MRELLRALKELEDSLEAVEGERFGIKLVILQREKERPLLAIELLNSEELAERIFHKALDKGILEGQGSFDIYRIEEEEAIMYSRKEQEA